MADFSDLKKWVTQSWDAQGAWREQAESDFAFIDGHQWSDAEKNELEANSRAPIVFNRTAVIVSSVAGSEINNRTEVRFIPREIGDVKPNEILTAGAEWFRDQSDAEDADSEAFYNLLICGLGATDTTLDFEEDPEGKPTVDNLDPLTVGWDMYSRKKGLIDSRYFFTVEEKATEEMLERFPDFTAEDIDASWVPSTSKTSEHTTTAGDQYAFEDGDASETVNDTVTVVRIQYRERVRVVEVVDPTTGKRVEIPEDKFKKISAGIPINIPMRKITKWEWKQAFLGAKEVLDENQPDPDGSTIKVMTGAWDRKDQMFYGLLRSMRDPQRYANKWLSQTMFIYGTNAKGGIIAETGAAEDVNQFEESWAASDAVTWVQPGKLGAITEKPGPKIPAGLMGMVEFAITSIRDASGVNMELLGMRDANQPGVLEYQRRQAAMTTLARYFDSLRFYRKSQGRTILNMLRNHIAPTGRLVRIVRDDQDQYIPMAMGDESVQYDVIVDDAPQAPNEKEKTWSIIQGLMPILQGAGLAADDWADILEYSPLPSSFAEKVREKARAQAEKANKQPSPMEQMQIASMKASVEKTQSETQENVANAALDAARAAEISQNTKIAPLKAMADLIPRGGASPTGA